MDKEQFMLMNLPARPEEPIKIYPAPAGKVSDGSKCVLYHHIDGMYSYCTTEKGGGPLHLSVATPLEEYKDGYRIKDLQNE